MAETGSGAAATDGRRALVIGAGIVGTCSALYLQREGFRVTLVDRDGPGEGCSSGNAANIGLGTYPPAGILAKVPGMLMDPRHPLFIRWPDLPGLVPWFARYALASAPRRRTAVAQAIDDLHRDVIAAYDTLFAETGTEALVVKRGMVFTYESRRSFEADTANRENYRRRGLVLTELDRDEVHQMEPDLGPAVECGVHLDGTEHTVDPLRLTRAFAESFQRRGGTILRETVRDLETGADGPPRVVTDAATHAPDLIVLAAGAWSGRLAARLGSRVPLAAERGYHVMLPDPGVSLSRPIRLSDRYVVVTPMEHGLRLTGIAEFSGLDKPSNDARADLVLRQAQAVIPGIRTEGMTRWMGHRPSTPDSIPVIGRSPRHPSVLFAFGHSHSGLSQAAVTGRLIGELAAGRPTSIDLAPFRPERF
ncbi:MAG: FAD-binding oxidoreductase [Rhodospirillales bacterium]|nr:FAD-binding oxidoreductase [Rhodospirillales bacterium]